MTTPDRQALVDQLVHHEGLRLKPYVDTAGKVSIGVGRNLTDDGISSREAMDLLDHDLDEAITDLAGRYAWFVALDAVRQRAIVDFRFNVGARGLSDWPHFLGFMALRQYADAASQLRGTPWAQEVGTRADDLIHMIETGTDPT